MANYANLIETAERTTVEDFGNNIRDAVIDIDPWSKNLVESSMGVTRDGFGRGWQKIQLFKTGLAGAGNWYDISGPAPRAPNKDSEFTIYGAGQTFAATTRHTAPNYYPMTATLKGYKGSLTIPAEVIRMDQNPANVANQVDAILTGTAKRVALQEILSWWARSQTLDNGGVTAGAYVVGTASGNIVVKADGTLTGIFDADDGTSYYDCLRLFSGMEVDIFEDNAGTVSKLNSQAIFVAHSDPVARQFTLVGVTGSDVTLTAGRQYEIHPAASSATDGTDITTYQPTSLESVVTASGSPYGIALSTHPYFKSTVVSVDSPLTETILNRYVAIAMHSKASMDRIDSLVTTPGVKANYIASLDYSGRREASRTPIRVNDGFANEWDYTYDGTNMRVDCSTFCPSGTLFGLKMRDGNWKKLMPPTVTGTGTQGGFGTGVEFYANLTHPGIFSPERDGNGDITDNLQAPFKRWVEFLPDVISGLKLTGLHELIGAEDGTST